MRIIPVIFAALVLFVACKSDKTESTAKEDSLLPDVAMPDKGEPKVIDSANFTTVQWIDSLKDFGTVKHGQMVDVVFRFKNTGDKPLIVENAIAGCGCTVPEKPEQPIMPGEEGFIKARFNSQNQGPEVTKNITVIMNTKPMREQMVAFKGKVVRD